MTGADLPVALGTLAGGSDSSRGVFGPGGVSEPPDECRVSGAAPGGMYAVHTAPSTHHAIEL
ncbi:hypothetical protein FRAHR75_720012 [Frankia sp. Hr75.2]|nr:hypothetical protein FRAHR75_720012 [Frankia sp. Hr75.2]SQD94799.1 hypothetical protein FMEAI12_2780007 [Parafrankia sp. Ea1.12]